MTPDDDLAKTQMMPVLRPEQVAPPASDASRATPSVEEPDPRPGWTRLKGSLTTTSRSQVVVGALLALVGFAAVVQIQSMDADETYEGRREEELIEIFNGLTGASDRARRDIERLEQTRRDLQVDSSARQAAVEQADQRLQTLNVLAGLVPVTGPGIRVTITEGENKVAVDSLLDTVQELRTAGAEAMEFNDEIRLVVSSHFEVIGGVVHVDGAPLSSPYVLEAIGESHTLKAGLEFPSGPKQRLQDDGAEVAIDELDRVDVTSVRELSRVDFAEPTG